MGEEFNQSFIQLVIGLQSMAWNCLGKQINPMTGKVEVNLDAAKDAIDTLLMLQEKTKGNLTEAEQSILTNSLGDLQLNFVEVKNKEEEKNDSEENTEDKKDSEKKDKDNPDDNQENKTKSD